MYHLISPFFIATLADRLSVSRSFGRRAISLPAARWLLIAVVSSFTLLLLTTSSVRPTRYPSHTPYGVLGVTVTASNREIASAYLKAMNQSIRLWPGSTRLAGLQSSYETLADPYQRCIYHRDERLPDWYGVPRLCCGELVLDKLKVAKSAIKG